MSVSIRHKGIITAVGKDKVKVAISPTAEDCNGCAISQICAKNESVDVWYKNPGRDLIGRRVTIEISSASQTRAVMIMLAAPIFIMVAVMIISVWAGLSEKFAALISVACVALWYAVVYLLARKKLGRQSIVISSIET